MGAKRFVGGAVADRRSANDPLSLRVFNTMHVDSTAIHDIDYRSRQGELLVRFTSGAPYLYVGVPSAEHKAFAEAPSKGRFFAEHIRDRCPYERLV